MSGWDDLYADPFWREWALRPPHEITLNWIRELHEAGASRVYDLGCGLGRHTVSLAAEGFAVVASDISPRALEATHAGLRAKGLRAKLLYADMVQIPLVDRSSDAVVSIGVLEHTTRAGMEQALAEITRVLRPGGRLLASFVPRSRWLPKDEPRMDMVEDNTLRCYGPEEAIHHLVDEAELRELLAGFTICAIDRVAEQYENCSSAELFLSATKPLE